MLHYKNDLWSKSRRRGWARRQAGRVCVQGCRGEGRYFVGWLCRSLGPCLGGRICVIRRNWSEEEEMKGEDGLCLGFWVLQP